MGDVTPLRKAEPMPDREPAISDCTWSTRRDPVTKRLQLRGHDVHTGALRIVWELRHAPRSDNTLENGKAWAEVANSVPAGAFALMVADAERADT